MKNDNKDKIFFKNIFCIAGFFVSFIFSIWLFIQQIIYFNDHNIDNPIVGWMVVFCFLTLILIVFFIIGVTNIIGNLQNKHNKSEKWLEILSFIFLIINAIIYLVLYFIVQEAIYSQSNINNLLDSFAIPLLTFLLFESIFIYIFLKQPNTVMLDNDESTKNFQTLQSLPAKPASPEELRLQNLKNELERKIAISQTELDIKELTKKYVDMQNKIKND